MTADSVEIQARTVEDPTSSSEFQIDALALSIAGAVAASSSSTAGALAGAGVAAVNTIGNTVQASIRNGSRVTSTGDGGLSLSAEDASTIHTDAIGASISIGASSGGNAGAIAIGISVSLNDIDNDVLAQVDQSSVTADIGDIEMTASEDAGIFSVAVAASVSVGASNQSALAISGGGAVALNSIRSRANVSITSSSIEAPGERDVDDVVVAGGAVTLLADSESKIEAKVIALAASVAASSSNSGAFAIGVSIARNFIGYDRDANLVNGTPSQIRAIIDDSTVTAGGALSVTATANQEIDALVLSFSVAVGVGGSNAFSLAGSGVFTENRIGTQVHASIRNVSGGITAASVSLQAEDMSDIEADAGAAAVSAAIGGSNAISISIGLSLAHNWIDNDIEASVIDVADVVAGPGGILIDADTSATIRTVAVAASLGVGIGSTAGIAVSGAGAESTNVILTRTNAFARNSVLSSAGALALDAEMSGSIEATVVAASVSVAIGSTAGVGVSIGVAVARNFIGYGQVTGVAFDYESTEYATKIETGDTVKITSGPMAGDVFAYVGDDDVSPTWDFEPADTPDALKPGQRVLLADGTVYAYIGDEMANPDLAVSAQDYAVNDDWRRVSALDGVSYNDATVWQQINLGAAPAQVQAYLQNSSADAAGALTLGARASADINAIVIAASAALGLGSTAGVAVSGAGVYTENKIKTLVKAYIDGDDPDPDDLVVGRIAAASVAIAALDSSTIRAVAGAASAAAALGGTAGVAVSIGVSIAFNEVSNEVEAFVVGAAVTTDAAGVAVRAETVGGLNFSSGQVTAGHLDDAAESDDTVADWEGDEAIRQAIVAMFLSAGGIVLATVDSTSTAANFTTFDGDQVLGTGALVRDPLTGIAHRYLGPGGTCVDLTVGALYGSYVQVGDVITCSGPGSQTYTTGSIWLEETAIQVSALVPGSSWTVVDGDGVVYELRLGPGGVSVTHATISAVSAAASVAIGIGGTAGIAVAGGRRGRHQRHHRHDERLRRRERHRHG